MDETTTIDDATTAHTTTGQDTSIELIEDELLVEEISIDGMCGVY